MSEPSDSNAGSTRRDDLAALRIDRDAPGPVRSPWVRRFVVGGVLVLLVAAGFVALGWFGGGLSVEVDHARRVESGAAPAGVVLTGTGYIVTEDRYISLGVRVPGRIQAYYVEEGDFVEAGQRLVELDSRSYRALLGEARASRAEAEATLALRRKELARLRELRTRGVASQAELDVKENEVAVGEAAIVRVGARVARLVIDVEDTVLRAPTEGVVLQKFKEVGEIATPGGFAGSGELIRIANTSELRAELDVNEADLSKVTLGQAAQVTPDAYPDRVYDAVVAKLYPQINRQKGTLRVEVRILEPDATLRPDMSVRLRFLQPAAKEPEAAGEPAVLVRADALRHDAGGAFVWVVTDGRLRRQTVESSGTNGGQAVIRQGLSGGEAVVVGNAVGAEDGAAVEVRPAAG
jgi:HlyD family secretion protein